eukprot:m.133072 g.133072  ORF g.133072 m.133072 type:complete len:1078 (+) comp16872_c0_seq3:903-4136(+)
MPINGRKMNPFCLHHGICKPPTGPAVRLAHAMVSFFQGSSDRQQHSFFFCGFCLVFGWCARGLVAILAVNVGRSTCSFLLPRNAAMAAVSAALRLARCVAVPRTVLAAAVRCASSSAGPSWLRATDNYMPRHLGPSESQTQAMLAALGLSSLEELFAQTVPSSIAVAKDDLDYSLFPGKTESEALAALNDLGKANTVAKSYIGMGYYNCSIPTAIKTNILGNPGWYTQYTPYQPEISQGRLESLVNFQTMVTDLTGMEIANASLLCEGTAAAEAFNICHNVAKGKKNRFLVDAGCHPQVIDVLGVRAKALGVTIDVQDPEVFDFGDGNVSGVLLSYPNTYGHVTDIQKHVQAAHDHGALAACTTDLLALTLLTPPGEMGCDVVVGSSQRFGTPLGYGGPHAGFIATHEAHVRRLPGRLVGVSKDRLGKTAFRLAIQTRETHIRRERATSNICTAQALLANMTAMYAVYHGPEGLRDIATRVHRLTCALAAVVERAGHEVVHKEFFDTLTVSVGNADELMQEALARNINLRRVSDTEVGVSLDEATTPDDLYTLMDLFHYKQGGLSKGEFETATATVPPSRLPEALQRTSSFLTHPNFNSYNNESAFMRYCKKLENRDMSLVHSMIPLGSCTMKLNSATALVALSDARFADLHPFAPKDQAKGYSQLFDDMRKQLCDITGYDEVSLQPHSGATGEFAGLLAIRGYLESKGETQRNICLIPVSAHGTNPASAALAGFKVAKVNTKKGGEIDLEDLQKQCTKHKGKVGALMITYPSTYGVFDENVRDVCNLIHDEGGQVYLDGANLNAELYLCKPGHFGADVSHFNMHKTFCIPHGGGGPGMGPIGVKAHLAPFLPSHSLVQVPTGHGGSVASSPYGSPLVLTISWMYMQMAGVAGLRDSSLFAILGANYMASQLASHFPLRFTGAKGRVAHEFIIDFSPYKHLGITCMDVAKRLQDYGFHPPTVSWPVDGALMIEPTECEDKEELDRYVTALLSIREEIREVEEGVYPQDDNPIANAPHSLESLLVDDWKHPYSVEKAAYPAPWLRRNKHFPSVTRLDEAYGDLHLACSCPPMDHYDEL